MYEEIYNSIGTVADIDDSEYEPEFKSREDYLEKQKDNIKIYSLGSVDISGDFRTEIFHIAIREKFHITDALFLTNIKDNQLKSMTFIANCFRPKDWNEPYTNDTDFTISSLDKGLFVITGETKEEFYHRFDYYPLFYFDTEGYVKVLKDCYIAPYFTTPR